MRPWSPIPIEECGEPLQALPSALLRMEPHPYMALGAPYGASGNPFQLRLGVVQRLLDAQQRLIEHDPSLRLSIFDAWRPIAVQAFMVDHSIAELCRARGVEVCSGTPSIRWWPMWAVLGSSQSGSCNTTPPQHRCSG